MDNEDRKDIIKKINTAGNGEDNEDDNSDNEDDSNDDFGDSDESGDDFGGDLGGDEPSDEEDLQEFSIYEGEMGNLFLDKPKKNEMFQPGSNDILDEDGGCWTGYKRKAGTEKFAKGSCVKIDENHEAMEGGESLNYMFWQNLKTIHHASGELLEMNQQQIDEMCANGHAWAVDHIGSSADDIEEVYHFFEGNLNEYDGETEGGYEDEYGSVENVNMNESEYKGKTVKLGKPSKGDVKNKKFKVYVKNKKGNIVKVNFGDANMEIKRDNPKNKKSFRARHNCAQAKDRTTPKYWSCKMWSSTPVSKIVGENLVFNEKNSTFDKNYLIMKVQETFNHDAEPMIQPQIRPEVVPSPDKVQPNIAPSRKNKPFLPMPEVTPDPKAIN